MTNMERWLAVVFAQILLLDPSAVHSFVTPPISNPTQSNSINNIYKPLSSSTEAENYLSSLPVERKSEEVTESLQVSRVAEEKEVMESMIAPAAPQFDDVVGDFGNEAASGAEGEAKVEDRPPILFFDPEECELDEEEIYDMVAARVELRADRDFKAADSLLDELEENGILVTDLPKEDTYELRYLSPHVTTAMLRARLRAAGINAGGNKNQLYKRLVENDVEADWDAPAETSYVPTHLQDPDLDYTPSEEFVDFDKELIGRVIGRRGAAIRKMEESSGCQINVIQEEDYPNARLNIEGPAFAIPTALQMIRGAVENAEASAKRAQKEFERKRGIKSTITRRSDPTQQQQVRQEPIGNRVFVHNLPLDCTYEDLKEHFSKAGTVAFARVSTDRDGRPKGCGVVQFETKVEADKAILMLNEEEFRGRRLGVREDVAFDTRKNNPVRSKSKPREETRSFGGSPGRMDDSERKANRVYVSGLPYKATWEDLKDFFKQNFEEGNVVYTEIHEDRDGRSKGCGIVQFENEMQREAAIRDMNDADFWGRQIFVREDRDEGQPRSRGRGRYNRNQAHRGNKRGATTRKQNTNDFDVPDGGWLEDHEDPFYY